MECEIQWDFFSPGSFKRDFIALTSIEPADERIPNLSATSTHFVNQHIHL